MGSTNAPLAIGREYPPASVDVDSRMTPEYRATLVRLLADQARAELAASTLYSRWVSRVPTPEDKQYVALIAREETEHWYRVVKLLEELGLSPDQARAHQTRSWFYVLFSLLLHRVTWLDLLMMAFLIDQAGYVLVEDFAQSSYAPWARVAREILAEEEGHPEFGMSRLRAMIATKGQTPVQHSLDKWWRVALNLFGPPTTKNTERYIRLGLKYRTNEDRRLSFRQSCEPRIRQLGLAVPRLYREHYPFI
jgi:ring-1,2-phenylacetyl-CoA epoxidase subunit PaaA